MKTDLNKFYKLRNIKKIANGPDIDGWVGMRANGSWYFKRYKGGAHEFKGGPALDSALHKEPDYKAYEV